jgi:hypothetical protein
LPIKAGILKNKDGEFLWKEWAFLLLGTLHTSHTYTYITYSGHA